MSSCSEEAARVRRGGRGRGRDGRGSSATQVGGHGGHGGASPVPGGQGGHGGSSTVPGGQGGHGGATIGFGGQGGRGGANFVPGYWTYGPVWYEGPPRFQPPAATWAGMVSPPVAVSVAAPVAAAAPAAAGVVGPVASGAPGPSAPAAAQTGNILLERAWSAHDATNAILSECGVPGDAYPNSFEAWGMAQRKVIYKIWMAHVKANRANRPTA